VNASGPARGKPTAPVTIVEFGDFQCPYCAQAEATLQAVLAKHPDDVRLVFRHFPLTELHPNAQISAVAAVCADQQGKFWELHDAMYRDQGALSAAALQVAAARAGVDTDRYAQCMQDPQALQVINSDLRAGTEAGVAGTPAFFVNGRPLGGNVPLEAFEAILKDELARAHSAH